MKLRNLLGIFLIFITFCGECQDLAESKINGISLVSERFMFDSMHIDPIVEVGANYSAVIPFCFMPYKDSSILIFENSNFWEGESLEGIRIAIQELHKNNIKTMIKPQIWVGHGVYTGEIDMKSEEIWISFEENYSDYILAFAKIAEEQNVDMLCIGTEMKRVVANRPELFPALIAKVKEVYSGKITYAENWDCFEAVQFWNELDYIGIDAYFPISKEKRPSVKKLMEGWTKYLPIFDSLSASFNKKILFTEFGYRSIRKCASTPWNHKKSDDQKIDQKSQIRALEALFESIWCEDYFAGGFLWKWHPEHESAGGKDNSMFTVQNKEAEKIVKEWYSANSN